MKKNIILLIILSTLVVLFTACTEKAKLISAGETEQPEKAVTEEPADVESEQTETAPETVCVYVCGAVVSPGVYTLPAGSRRVDALEAAGGFAEDAARDYVNLAQTTGDGEQLYIPHEDEISPGLPESTDPQARGSAQPSLVNINTATKEELMTLPGIGESKASDIISDREKNGAFASIEDIKRIQGIKDGTYNRISSLITVN